MSRISKLYENSIYREYLLNLFFKDGLKYIFEDIEAIEKFIEQRLEKNIDDTRLLKDLKKLYKKHTPAIIDINKKTKSTEFIADTLWKDIGLI